MRIKNYIYIYSPPLNKRKSIKNLAIRRLTKFEEKKYRAIKEDLYVFFLLLPDTKK